MTTPGTPDPYQSFGTGGDPGAPGGYPAGGADPSGSRPDPASYPPPAGFPQQGAYPPAGGYAPPGAHPQQGAYPPPGGAPYQADAVGAHNTGAYNTATPNAYPPPSGQPAGYPVPGMVPPPAPASRKKRQWIIIGVSVVVILAVVGFVVYRQQKTAITAAAVGGCIKVTSATMTNPDTSQAPCTDPLAIYVVTETGSGSISCDDHEDSYEQGKDAGNPDSRVCLRPNLKAGDCWDPGLTSFDVPKKLDCTSAKSLSAQKLLALVTTSSDDSSCPDSADKVLPLVKRNMIYCFGPVS